MKRSVISLGCLGLAMFLIPTVSAGQSLADIARAEREKQNQQGKKPAKVYTNEDVAKAKAEPGEQTTATGETSGNTITAVTRDGRTVRVAPAGDTDLIFMATWCPHSEHLKQVLKDARTRPYFANQKLVFLFSDEWQHIKSSVEKSAKSQNIPDDEVAAELERLKSQSGTPYVYDTQFLDGLPGPYYFCFLPSKVDGFPTVLSASGYTTNWTAWLIDDRNMPQDLETKVEEDHKPKP